MTTGSKTTLDDIFRRASFWRSRNDEIKKVARVWEMEDDNKVPGYEAFVSSDARAGLLVATHILSANDAKHRIPLGTEDVQQRAMKNGAERLLHGAWRSLDTRRMHSGRTPIQRELASWMLATGFWHAFYQVIIRPGGSPDFVADVWDSTEGYPEWGGIQDGLIAFDHIYTSGLGGFRRKAQRAGWSLAGLNGESTQGVSIIDHWESRYNPAKPDEPDILNSVYVGTTGDVGNDAPATEVKPLNRENLIAIPIMSGAVGGMPTPRSYYGGVVKAASKFGRSMLETNMINHEALNRFWTYTLQEAQNQVKRILIHQSPGGEGGVEPKDLDQKDTVINLDLRESLREMERSGVGTSTAYAVIDRIGEMFQRAGFTWLQFGQQQGDISGVAIERLNELAKSVVVPSQRRLEAALAEIDYRWMSEWKRLTQDGKLQSSVRFAGRMRGRDEAGYFDEEFTPDMLPNTRWVDVSISLALTVDKLTKANIARMLVPGNAPLMDTEHVLDEYMGEEDPALRQRRAREETVFKLPEMVALDALRRLRQQLAATNDPLEKEFIKSTMIGLQNRMMNPQGQAPAEVTGVNPAAGAQFYGNGREQPASIGASRQAPALPAPGG